MGLKRPEPEDIILWIAGLLTIVAILWLLVGCTANKQSAVKVDYSTGCHFTFEGMSSKQAIEMVDTWALTDCTVDFESDYENRRIPPKDGG